LKKLVQKGKGKKALKKDSRKAKTKKFRKTGTRTTFFLYGLNRISTSAEISSKKPSRKRERRRSKENVGKCIRKNLEPLAQESGGGGVGAIWVFPVLGKASQVRSLGQVGVAVGPQGQFMCPPG